MTMRSADAPRRLYPRAGSLVLLFGGIYYSPAANKATEMNAEKEVTIEMLEKSSGKHRIQVTQKVGKKPAVIETWIEKNVVFGTREKPAKSASKSA